MVQGLKWEYFYGQKLSKNAKKKPKFKQHELECCRLERQLGSQGPTSIIPILIYVSK